MNKQTSTVVSISGRKIAAILLILICSFAVAWATHSGRGASVKPVQPLVAHTNQPPMGGQPVSPATHNHNKAAAKANTHHMQGALSTFKAHIKKSSRARQSKGARLGANQGAGGGGSGGGIASVADQAGGQGGANQGAGQGAKSKSDETPSPTPEESPGLTSDTTLGLSATTTGTSRWPRAAATPMPSP
jgi:hypothetical protein